MEVTVPCGQCRGCRLEYSRQWAMRILHESSLYEENSFLTLTYEDAFLPENESLEVRHWQLFMKRLKKYYKGKQIRFFHCGEYGETTGRPHYHAVLLGHDFEDKKFLKYTENGDPLYTSLILDTVWGLGDCYIGDVTFESAAYCGRYVMKKLTGNRKSEYGSRVPEYCTQSRRPGIGTPWLEKWKTDVYPNDFCVMNGKRVRVPKFYDAKLKQSEPDHGTWTTDETGFPVYMPSLKRNLSDKLRAKRKQGAHKHQEDNTRERLAVREEILNARLSRLTRKL